MEDEADIRRAVVFRLKQAGFLTLMADDGATGLRMAQAMRPDLVVLDLKLPELPGEEVCKSIKEGPDLALRRTPVIMVTAKSSDVDRVVGHVIGADCYMTKPFDMDELILNVMKLIKSGR